MTRKTVNGRINTKPEYGCKIDGELVEAQAHFIAGDWAVVDNYHPRAWSPYIINHNPTGLCVGMFSTIKAARNCVKELATLPCDSHINEDGVLRWNEASDNQVKLFRREWRQWTLSQ